MKATQEHPSATLPNPTGAPQLKWDGHMADDVGSTYGPNPLASLIATTDALVLSGPRGHFEMPRSAVTKLGRGKMYPWLFSAVRIHHTISKYPVDLQFKPLGIHPRAVLEQLRALGYPA